MFKQAANRALLTILAVVILGLSLPRVSYAAENPVSCEQERSSADQTSRSNADGISHPLDFSDAVITTLRTARIPAADDRSEESRSYICAASGEKNSRSISIRKLVFLLSDIKYSSIYSLKGEGGDDRTASAFDDLFIIHFIHKQDGSKG